MKWNIAFILLLPVLSVQISQAQKSEKKIKITGVVVDSERKPVEGAFIFIDEVKTDIVTDSKGMYTIKVLPIAKSLTILSLYGDVKEMEIDGNTVINLILDKTGNKTGGSLQKESEIVDIGYGTAKKEKMVNSVPQTQGNNSRSKSYLNIFEMIKSEVPGVQVSGSSIQLQQGSGSLTSSTEPLFVLDGTIVNQINDIVPSQVSSISLLKGPAASIYGVRGANGVIVINLMK
jgi:TonB-dependent SusC/RagA subfamily outer membrane receptor